MALSAAYPEALAARPFCCLADSAVSAGIVGVAGAVNGVVLSANRFSGLPSSRLTQLIIPSSSRADPVVLDAALYVVATPIGNLSDITLRALDVLRAADCIAAEDTRHTLPLLRHYGIDRPLLAVHEHNEASAAEGIVSRIEAGQVVALVSDAGTPGVSDPGARVVARVLAAGLRVVPIPGPSALTATVSVAGLPAGPLTFLGFLPPKSTARRQQLDFFAKTPAHLMFYEAPHRLLETLADAASVVGGQRTVVLGKELTKLFEAVWRGPLGGAADWLLADPNRLKGEFVVVLHAAESDRDDQEALEGERVLKLLLAEGLPVKQAASLAASITGAAKNMLYAKALVIRERA